MHEISKYYCGSNYVIEFVSLYFEFLFQEELANIKVSIQKWNKGYPMTVPKRLNPEMRNTDVDYYIFLDSDDYRWSQNIYQLAHEYSHVVMGCYPNDKKLKWISECLCESASIHLLRITDQLFEKYNPSFVEKNKQYLSNILTQSPTLDFQEILDFIVGNIEELESDPTESTRNGRPRNSIIGKHWSGLIGVNTNGWKSIRHFSNQKIIEIDRFHFLRSWYACCINEDERVFVRSIAETIIGRDVFKKLVK